MKNLKSLLLFACATLISETAPAQGPLYVGTFTGTVNANGGNVATFGSILGSMTAPTNCVVVNVSAHGIADGYSTVTNNGAQLGIDSVSSGTYGLGEYLANLVVNNGVNPSNFVAVKFVFGPGIFYFTNTIGISCSTNFYISLEGQMNGATRFYDTTTNNSGPMVNFNSPASYNGSTPFYTGGANLDVYGITFAAANGKNRALLAVTNFSSLHVQKCGFFNLNYFTNAGSGSSLSIFAGTFHTFQKPSLIGLSYTTGGDITTVVVDNQFFGLADGINGGSDHLVCVWNTFGEIGKNMDFTTNNYPATVNASLGGAFVGGINIGGIFQFNHLYQSRAGLCFDSGGLGESQVWVQDNEIEGTQSAIAADADGGIAAFDSGTAFTGIWGPTSGFTVQPGYAFGSGTFAIDTALDQNSSGDGKLTTTHGFSAAGISGTSFSDSYGAIPASTNLLTKNGNGSGLTNLNPNALSSAITNASELATNPPNIGSLLISPDGTLVRWTRGILWDGAGNLTISNSGSVNVNFVGGGATNVLASQTNGGFTWNGSPIITNGSAYTNLTGTVPAGNLPGNVVTNNGGGNTPIYSGGSTNLMLGGILFSNQYVLGAGDAQLHVGKSGNGASIFAYSTIGNSYTGSSGTAPASLTLGGNGSWTILSEANMVQIKSPVTMTNYLTVTNGVMFPPIAAYAGPICTNGNACLWNSNGQPFLRYSTVGAVTSTDKALTP